MTHTSPKWTCQISKVEVKRQEGAHKMLSIIIKHDDAATSAKLTFTISIYILWYLTFIQKKNLNMQKPMNDKDMGLNLPFQMTADLRAFQEFAKVPTATL